MLDINADLKYDTLYKGPLEIMQCLTNGMVTLQYVPINISYNICHMKPYTSDTHMKDITVEN